LRQLAQPLGSAPVTPGLIIAVVTQAGVIDEALCLCLSLLLTADAPLAPVSPSTP
jgi:hypothetical protein